VARLFRGTSRRRQNGTVQAAIVKVARWPPACRPHSATGHRLATIVHVSVGGTPSSPTTRLRQLVAPSILPYSGIGWNPLPERSEGSCRTRSSPSLTSPSC
jgi:hypothetical protein